MRGQFHARVLLVLFCNIMLLSACRFQAPSASEGQELAKRGVFPAGPPSWVRQPDGMKQIPADAGVIPQSFTVPEAAQQTRESIPDHTVAEPKHFGYDSETRASLAEDSGRVKRSSEELEESEEGSPLDRIEAACPGLESTVVAALQTTEIQNRIKKYENLTSRCPYSADLWLWLGKDYQSQQRYVEASRCFERVLTIDHSNEVARALLSSVKKHLNE